jgi:hypothetical protein
MGGLLFFRLNKKATMHQLVTDGAVYTVRPISCTSSVNV